MSAIDTIVALAESGVDIIELGIPFSEPIADGPVIQRSGERALRKGAYLPAILQMVRDIRKLIAEGGSLPQATDTIGLSERAHWKLFDSYNARNVTAAYTELEWE